MGSSSHFASLALGLLPTLWYWRARRFGWVAGILAAELLAFSFSSAVFHGWMTQATMLIAVATVVVAVALFVGIARFSRRFESVTRAAVEELNGDPLFRHVTLFRDDGQRITVYPRRRLLAFRCVVQAAVLAGVGCAFAFLRVGNLLLWIGLGSFGCLGGVIFLATLYRLVIRKPSLVVGPDGILDDGTLLWTGVGLIHWDEILAVFPSTRSAGWTKQHFLTIMVTDLPEIRRHLPLLKRLALSNTYSQMSQLLVGQSLLETPVADLAEAIDRYAEAHAPTGWRASVEEQEDDSAPTSGNEGADGHKA